MGRPIIKQKLAEVLMTVGGWLISKAVSVGSSVKPEDLKCEEHSPDELDQVNQVEPLAEGATWAMTDQSRAMLHTPLRPPTQQKEKPLEGSLAAGVEAVRGRW